MTGGAASASLVRAVTIMLENRDDHPTSPHSKFVRQGRQLPAFGFVLALCGAALCSERTASGQVEPDCCAWQKVELVRIEYVAGTLTPGQEPTNWVALPLQLPAISDVVIVPHAPEPDITVRFELDISAGLEIEDNESYTVNIVWSYLSPKPPTFNPLPAVSVLGDSVGNNIESGDPPGTPINFAENYIELEFSHTFDFDGTPPDDPKPFPPDPTRLFYEVTSSLLVRGTHSVKVRATYMCQLPPANDPGPSVIPPAPPTNPCEVCPTPLANAGSDDSETEGRTQRLRCWRPSPTRRWSRSRTRGCSMRPRSHSNARPPRPRS